MGKICLPYVNNPILKNLDLFVNNENEPIEYLCNNNLTLKRFLEIKFISSKQIISIIIKKFKNRMLNEIFNK